MSDFEKVIPDYRLTETRFGDDLQAVAAREMGDANRWPELVWLNSLTYPYLTDDKARVSDTVLLNGSLIRVPAPVGVYTDTADRGQVYERDCKLTNKMLSDDGNGDFLVVAGAKNLTQQLQHRLNTPRGQARRHPEYGCMIWRMLGADDPMEAHKIDSRGIFERGRSADVKEGVMSFLEKRAPKFPDKVSKDMPPYFPWWEERGYK